MVKCLVVRTVADKVLELLDGRHCGSPTTSRQSRRCKWKMSVRLRRRCAANSGLCTASRRCCRMFRNSNSSNHYAWKRQGLAGKTGASRSGASSRADNSLACLEDRR